MKYISPEICTQNVFLLFVFIKFYGPINEENLEGNVSKAKMMLSVIYGNVTTYSF